MASGHVPYNVHPQARVGDKTTVVSTSTRNFPNRLGKGANVYLASAELAAVAAMMGKLPTPAEYLSYAQQVTSTHPNPSPPLDSLLVTGRNPNRSPTVSLSSAETPSQPNPNLTQPQPWP